MLAKVHVMLKSGVLDPQAKAIEHALAGLGFEGIDGVRQGKYFEIDLSGLGNEEAARQRVEAMCQQLLANAVIENYAIEIADEQ